MIRLEGFVESAVKVGISLMNTDQQETCKVIPYQWGNSLNELAFYPGKKHQEPYISYQQSAAHQEKTKLYIDILCNMA